MLQIQNVSDDPNQQQTLVLPDGSSLLLQLSYAQQQFVWFANITYGTFALNGLQITNLPNMLRQFKSQIPFGFACYSKSNREPSQVEDFASGASTLFILTAEEVQEYEAFLAGGPT